MLSLLNHFRILKIKQISTKGTKAALVAGAIVLTVLLFFLPRQPKVSETDQKADDTGADIGILVRSVEKAMKPEQLKSLQAMPADSLPEAWLRLGRPDVAAYYTEQLAKKKQLGEEWLLAGKRYYNAVQFTQDQSEVPQLFQSAMRCMNKAGELGADSTAVNIYKARCLVEGTNQPMDGIQLLRRVERYDSLNTDLNLTFAFFSVKSGQTEKAIQRFKKVLRADSLYIEAYLHLADCYVQTGVNDSAIVMLQRYSSRVPDLLVRAEVNKYIEQLKQNIKN